VCRISDLARLLTYGTRLGIKVESLDLLAFALKIVLKAPYRGRPKTNLVYHVDCNDFLYEEMQSLVLTYPSSMVDVHQKLSFLEPFRLRKRHRGDRSTIKIGYIDAKLPTVFFDVDI
jgi:hypothetical protein